MKISGIILAAGMSSRMKDFKPLLKLDHKTLIENTIDSMLNSNIDQIIVVLGHRANEIEDVLRSHYIDQNIKITLNHEYEKTDMLHSVKIGINALTNFDAFFLLPGDMPAISPNTFKILKEKMENSNAKIAFPTLNGFRKHPPLISSNCVKSILKFNSNGGLRELWNDFENFIIDVPVFDLGCALDADTKSDFEKCSNYIKKNF